MKRLSTWVHVWAIWVIILDNVDAFRLPAVSTSLLHSAGVCNSPFDTDRFWLRQTCWCRLSLSVFTLFSYEYILQRSSIFHLQNGVLVTQDNAMRYIMRRENEKKVGNLRPGFTSPHLLSSNVKCNTLPQVWHLEYSTGLIWSKFLCPAQTVGSNLSRLIKTGEN